MHLRLRELASPLDTPEYPSIEIPEATISRHQSVSCFSNYLETQFARSFSNMCNITDCFVCSNSNQIIHLIWSTLRQLREQHVCIATQQA